MYTQLKTFTILAIAGSAVAAPWGNWGSGQWKGDNDDNERGQGQQAAVTETAHAVVTAYTTVFNGGAQPTPAAGQFYNKPKQPEQPEQPEEAVATSTWAAWSSSAPAPSAAPPASGSNAGYMAVVSEYRSKMGLSALQEDSTLVANAGKTARDGDGQMVHQLNPGSMGQVLAPGSPDEFEKVFVGGWLCEKPGMAGLDGVCSSMSNGWDYQGQTGHAEILTSKSYSKIGCGCEGGIWACDLA